MSGEASVYENEWSSYQLAYGHSIDKDNELLAYGHAQGGDHGMHKKAYHDLGFTAAQDQLTMGEQ